MARWYTPYTMNCYGIPYSIYKLLSDLWLLCHIISILIFLLDFTITNLGSMLGSTITGLYLHLGNLSDRTRNLYCDATPTRVRLDGSRVLTTPDAVLVWIWVNSQDQGNCRFYFFKVWTIHNHPIFWVPHFDPLPLSSLGLVSVVLHLSPKKTSSWTSETIRDISCRTWPSNLL